MEGKDRRTFEAWCADWLTRNPPPPGRESPTICEEAKRIAGRSMTATEARLGEAALVEDAGSVLGSAMDRLEKELLEPLRELAVAALGAVENPVEDGDNSEEPSPCKGISDAECRSRPGCKMPDGSWCPVFTPPTWGTRW